MYNLMAVDMPLLAPLFLCSIVVLGSFFLINIILAVILDSFISVQQEELRKAFILEHLGDLDRAVQVDDKLNNKIAQVE